MKSFKQFLLEHVRGTPWTFEEVKELSDNYDTVLDFLNHEKQAYISARRNGWLSMLFPERKTPKTRGYWNVKENVKKEAEKYSTPTEMYKKNGPAYRSALRNKWIDDFFPLKNKQQGGPPNVWFEDNTRELASKYRTISDFSKHERGAYLAAVRNKWIDDFFPINKRHSRPHNYWNDKGNLKKEADKYSSPFDMEKNNKTAYRAAIRNKWIDDFFPNKIRSRKWTKEEASDVSKEYINRSHFHIGNTSAYNAAYKNGWLDDFFPKKKNI